jgi:hypothetical protein
MNRKQKANWLGAARFIHQGIEDMKERIDRNGQDLDRVTDDDDAGLRRLDA